MIRQNKRYQLTWDADKRRWRKKYKGKRFSYSAGSKGKIGSYQDALNAFEAWKAEINEETVSPDRKKWEAYDAMLLGLTATPKAEVDHNTYGLFGLEDHVPTYAYELPKAVADEYLVPPKPVSVPLKFQREGIKYDELSDEEKERYEEKLYDDETGELPRQVDAGSVNKWLFNTDTVDKVLAHLMECGLSPPARR